MAEALDTLEARWNRLGRQYAADVQERLGRFHRGEVEDPQLPPDPRDPTMADRVLEVVSELNQQGRWREARERFDPAHEPFIPRFGNQGLPFAVVLGRDEALFRRGSTYQDGHLWHVSGETLTPLPGLTAAAVSPDRRMIAVAESDGVRVSLGWGGPEVARLAWPSREEMIPVWIPEDLRDGYEVIPSPSPIEALCVSNSGARVAIANGNGVLVGTARDGVTKWHLAMPLSDAPDEWILEELEGGETARCFADMVHVAMSGDGRLLACGTQDEGHHLLELDDDGRASRWASIGRLSEYPHNACFSHDAKWAALNSCHFYNGITLAAEVGALRGLTTTPYEEDPRAQAINRYLRVYASTWLPEGALPQGAPAFALAGASLLTFVTPLGEVLGELLFGSSASSIDYCPATRTLVLGSFSGFLHFFDLSRTDPTAPGWRPPKETKRWCFVPGMAPLQW